MSRFRNTRHSLAQCGQIALHKDRPQTLLNQYGLAPLRMSSSSLDARDDARPSGGVQKKTASTHAFPLQTSSGRGLSVSWSSAKRDALGVTYSEPLIQQHAGRGFLSPGHAVPTTCRRGCHDKEHPAWSESFLHLILEVAYGFLDSSRYPSCHESPPWGFASRRSDRKQGRDPRSQRKIQLPLAQVSCRNSTASRVPCRTLMQQSNAHRQHLSLRGRTRNECRCDESASSNFPHAIVD